MDLRKQFEKETNKKLEVEMTFNCNSCQSDVGVDVWNDNYIFWLESKVEKLNIDDVSKSFECITKRCTQQCTECGLMELSKSID